jgi:LDH2 family malate/lactate/ureidoglycolate dehydrogenase
MSTTNESGVNLVPIPTAEDLCFQILEALGVPGRDAGIVTNSLITADARGVSSHGISRLPVYAQRLQAGLINPTPDIKVIRDSPSAVLLDGANGFGHVVGARAMSTCLAKAGATGAAVAGVRQSTHFGTAGFFAQMATEEDMIGIVGSNGAPRMAAWGGRTSLLGTNPLAIAAPTGGSDPLLLDMATSAVALGKVILAAKRGEPIPTGWAMDIEGRPTTEAQAALDGLMLPLGGPKGSGLALMLDVLGGVLTGACFGMGIGSMYRDWDRSEGLGHVFIAIDIGRFLPIEEFKQRIDDLCAQVMGSDLAQGFDSIYLPGELEFLKERDHRTRGIQVDPGVWAEITALAGELGVS